MTDPNLVLVPLAAGMAVTIAYLVKWASEARSPLGAGTVTFLFLMMAGMLAGATLYYARPSFTSLIEGVWVASALMSVSVLIVFLSFIAESRRSDPTDSSAPPSTELGTWFLPTIVLLVLANELLMGWTFQAAAGSAPALSGSAGAQLEQLLTSSVNSPWFLFTMAAEMLLTSYLLRSRLPRAIFVLLTVQSAIMLFSPPALALSAWSTLSVYVASGLMIGLFVYLMEYLYRHREIGAGLSNYLAELFAVYALMMGGLFLFLYRGVGILFAVSIVLEMVVFFVAIVRPERLVAKRAAPWLERPHWTFALLSTVFAAELFMGAVLDLQVDAAAYLAAIPSSPLAGAPGTILLNAVSNGFWFIAIVTASTWFLVMMGLEMGMLVVFKLREARHFENRVRLALMLVSYSAFAVFYPSIFFSTYFPNAPSPSRVPVLGWSMGIGSYPLAIGVFGAVLATYAITGGLALLFGRRAVCSVLCTAPLMFQGTTIDAMSSFNRSGPVGRKYLSSRLSGTYALTSGAVMTSLVAASVVSYLDTTGALSVTVRGVDPTVFLFALYFSVLWYLMFVTIPYVGNYNCVTMGWCYTGTIVQAFQTIGFFKLKVRSREVCRQCTTLDCAQHCPVALVDMPGHFRTKGEFRSSKCCGVGDCIEACPYDNIYISDVRHWIRTRLGLPAPPVNARARLPMVGARSAPSNPPGLVGTTAAPSSGLPSPPTGQGVSH